MAVYRETPKCFYCGKPIASAVNRKQNPYNPVFGDSFVRWDYKKHWCIKGAIAKRKERKEFRERMSAKGIDIDNLFKNIGKGKS